MRKILFLAVLSFGFLPTVAEAQNVDVRLDHLENEIQTLSRALYRGEGVGSSVSSSNVTGADSPRMQADAQVRMQQLEVELRQLNGRMEEQAYAIKQMQKNLNKSMADAALRFDALEGGGSGSSFAPSSSQSYAAPSPAVPLSARVESMAAVTSIKEAEVKAKPEQIVPPAAAAPSSLTSSGHYKWSSNKTLAPPADNLTASFSKPVQADSVSASDANGATARYESAFSLLKGERYEDAEHGFSAFLKDYPQHILAANAQYWLGETYYVRGRYNEAAQSFAEGFQKFPKASKAPDNLLKLGMSLSAMGKREDACLALQQIDKEFAGAGSPAQRRATQEITRLGC